MLTHIDVPSRSRMSATLLHDILYLMGNRKIVELLIAEGALQFQELPRSQPAVPVVSMDAVAALFVDVISGGSAPQATLAEESEDAVEAEVGAEKRSRRDSPPQLQQRSPTKKPCLDSSFSQVSFQ